MSVSADMMFGRSGMGYVGAWDRHGGVQIALDHIRRRSGELHGEIVIECGAIRTAYGKLHRAAFNVSSTTSRDRLSKTLETRAPGAGDVPWKHLLEEFCTAVLEAERTGAPIVRVGRMEDEPNAGHLVEWLMPRGKTTILYAAGGTGKSYLACLIAVAVQMGVDVLGWRVHRTNVLYLDWETDAYEIDRRVKRVAKGLGLDDVTIDYRACAGPLDEMAESMSGYVTDHQIGLVIVDSVGMASGGSREGPAEESALRFFGALRHLGATVLAIDHVTGEDVKSGRPVDKPYGSIYKVNLARSTWELKGTPADPGEDSHMALFHRKTNVGGTLPPLGIRVTHTDDSVAFVREDIQDAGLVKGLSHVARITRYLSSGAASVSAIAEELDISEGVVRVTLNRGIGKAFVKRSDGTWGLAATP